MLLRDLLIEPEHSIVDQVHERFRPGVFYGRSDQDRDEIKSWAPMLTNLHGFGVTWYTDTLAKFETQSEKAQDNWPMRPAHFRTINPISTDLTFNALCTHTASTSIQAHIRAASYPPAVETNAHPFVMGNVSFMHNGGIVGFEDVRIDIFNRIYEIESFLKDNSGKVADTSVENGNYLFAIKGNSDTEHLAALYTANLDLIRAKLQSMKYQSPAFATETMLFALRYTIDDIHKIQNAKNVGPNSLNDRWGNFLNLCINDGGHNMITTRFRDSKEGPPMTLYLSLTAAQQLNSGIDDGVKHVDSEDDVVNVEIQTAKSLVDKHNAVPDQQGVHVIVGSEPATRHAEDWGLFEANQAFTHTHEGKISITDLNSVLDNNQFEKYREALTGPLSGSGTKQKLDLASLLGSSDVATLNLHKPAAGGKLL
jgi:glutamine amidotransferase